MTSPESPSRSIDEYLKVIFLITQKSEYAKTSIIAEQLSIYPSSVTEMLEKLDRQGLVEYTSYKGAKLTPSGHDRGRKILRRYRLLQVFFQNVLGLTAKEASEQACLMEHHISDKAEERICTMLDRPMESFDLLPIPKCAKSISCKKCLSLAAHDK